MTDLYLATVNTPGFLPMDDERHVFASAPDAWAHLMGERERDLRDMADGGPDYDQALADMESADHGPRTWPGTVYGPTPGYDGDHDLGTAYTVSLWAHADYPHEHGHLYGCEPCEHACHCDPDPDGVTETCVHCDLVATGEHECTSDTGCALH